jgi:hypothetical protein
MMGEDGMVTYKINKKRGGHHKMIGYPAFKSDRLKKRKRWNKVGKDEKEKKGLRKTRPRGLR